MATIKKACKGAIYPKSSNVSKRLGSPSKAKNGKSFPDLNKDGKITKADILKGRGVIAKKGMKIKKAQDGKKMNYTERAADAKKRYEASTNPKLEGVNRYPTVRNFQSIDTTGLAAGKTKGFPSKIVAKDRNTGELRARYRDADKKQIEGLQVSESSFKKRMMKKNKSMENYENMKKEKSAVQRKGGVTKRSASSKMKTMKTGGKMTKKCAYGCK